MKKVNTIITSFAAAALIMSSCSSNKILTSEKNQEIMESKETATASFVKMKDGSVVYYNTLELKKGMFTAPHLLANGTLKIMPSEIVAYQNNKHYAVSQSTFSSGRKSYVAKETLPGFAVRVVRGKLNIYCKQFFNGRAAIDEFYIQAGSEGKIYVYSPELMKQMIKDNEDAMSFFIIPDDSGELSKKLQTTASIYNNSGLLVSKN